LSVDDPTVHVHVERGGGAPPSEDERIGKEGKWARPPFRHFQAFSGIAV